MFVADIRGLVSDESIINDVVPEAFETYNKTQMLVVDNGDHKVIICNEGQVGHGEFLDGVSREVVSFDHITRKVTGKSSGAQHFSGKYEDFRGAIQRELDNYVQDHYATGSGSAFNANDGVVVVVSGSKYEPRNFWTGSWRSVWKLQFAPGKAPDVTLAGQVDLSVHFYEDGNVQLKANNALEVKIKGGATPEATAQAIFKAIDAAETKYQQALDVAFSTMDATTFKALRRQLPVTATKIDWDKITHAKIGANAPPKE